MIRICLLTFIFGAAPTAGAVAQSAAVGAERASPAASSDSTGGDTAANATRDAGAAGRRDPGGGECFRFVFGEWEPPLDAKAAGHPSFAPAESLPQAPDGRSWAFRDSTPQDVQMLLYPSFWPAGVSVRFPHAPRTASDTVRGRAIALVADGRVRSPEADATAWLVPCRR
ncbi:MAG TPA: hypothetical protein VFT57_18560 [Gemmatimonadaceae bacterium]|nr:hypothetical protein [Gemmatimonadaceae bacterium]